MASGQRGLRRLFANIRLTRTDLGANSLPAADLRVLPHIGFAHVAQSVLFNTVRLIIAVTCGVSKKVVRDPGAIRSRCESAGICSRSAYGCRFVDAKKMPDGLIEEMGLLYVGVTRARKAVYASSSMRRRTNYGNYQVACPSCLTSLPGIEPVSWRVMDGEG